MCPSQLKREERKENDDGSGRGTDKKTWICLYHSMVKTSLVDIS
jgi:hypothetical protein